MKRATAAVLTILIVVLLYQLFQHRRSLIATNDRVRALGDSIVLLATRNRAFGRLLTSAELPDSAVIDGYWDGRAVTIDLSATDSLTLLFMLDQACAACLRAIPFVEGLANVHACPLRTIALNTNPMANDSAYRLGGALPNMRTITEFSGWVIRALPTDVSPATVVIGRGGLIHGIWVGEHDERVRTEIDRSIRASCVPG